MEMNYLEHHGVKGMKWGVRRYQNPDGTLTAAGRRRLGLSEDEASKISKEKIHNFAYGQAAADYGNVGKGLGGGSNAARAGSNMASKKANKKRKKIAEAIDVSKMTDQDLQKAVNRMNLEQNYKRLKTGNIQTGHDRVADILDQCGDIMAIGASAASIALAIYTIKK